jgi:hypothetical protein
MSGSAFEEQVVHEVVRRLREMTAAGTSVPAREHVAAPNGNPSQAHELSLTDSVVSLGQLEGRLEGIRRVVLRPGAVVTPAVRDELRRRRVTLTFGNASGDQVRAAGQLLVGTGTDCHPPKRLAAAAAAAGWTIRQLEAVPLEEQVHQLQNLVCDRGRLGLLLGHEPAMAVCLANRHPPLRAAWAVDVASVDRAVPSIAANVLVVGPQDQGRHHLISMVRAFLQGMPRDCPPALRVPRDDRLHADPRDPTRLTT